MFIQLIWKDVSGSQALSRVFESFRELSVPCELNGRSARNQTESKQASNQASKQTSKQACKRAIKQGSKQLQQLPLKEV